MTAYRKIPIDIEATQWHKRGDHPEVKSGWLGDTGQVHCNTHPEFNVFGMTKVDCIQTLEGWHRVTAGDFIITGIKGEHYPCKPDVFEATYERV